jgi:hypothetical protein
VHSDTCTVDSSVMVIPLKFLAAHTFCYCSELQTYKMLMMMMLSSLLLLGSVITFMCRTHY